MQGSGQRVQIQPKRKRCEDAIAKQACLVQTQTTKVRGARDNCQELKTIMYNDDIRSKILVSQVSDGSGVTVGRKRTVKGR
jgi:hypothetical protein